MSSRSKLVLLGVALAHLALVFLSAFSFPVPHRGWIGKALALYSKLSGADSSYGFFAPEIGTQIEAKFDLVDNRGGKTIQVLESGNSHEADLRIGNILEAFGDSEDPNFQRALSASLTASLFNRFPEVTQVTIHFEQFTPVSMPEYRRGARSGWKPIYLARFVYPPRLRQ